MSPLSSSSLTGPEVLLGGRYRSRRVLKAAAGVETVLAEDTVGAGEFVVVRRAPLAAFGAATAARLQRDATALGRSHGGAAPLLLASGVEDGFFWLAQRFIPGHTLETRLASGPLTVDETLAVASDVLAQLHDAHELGALHRDVKPASIMLSPEPGIGYATLIDFGLARRAWIDPALHDQALGTARYVSPEQAELLDLPVDERSDLYSLGVVLFECIAGQPPFDAAQLSAVLRQHLVLPAPDLRTAAARVPKAVAEVVERLLRKDPAERYQSATAVLSDVESIASARRDGITDPAVVVGRSDRRTTLADPAFVGRARELGDLLPLLDAAASGLGGLAVVEGESGSGKSRLLDELARRATERGFWVLAGQGVDQGAWRPFELLDGVAAGVVEAAAADPTLAARLRGRLGVFAEPVAGALPRLAPMLATDSDAALPAAYGEARSVSALAAFLDALGASDHPALVVLDDCQWAPTVIARIISQWHRRRPRSGRGVTVVVSFRSDEVSPDNPLRSMHADLDVVLPPLAPAEVIDLVESMAGQVPADAVATVNRLSEGSPFMAQAVLHGMVECGALVRTQSGWALDPSSHGEVQASRRAALFLARRLDRLSDHALRLLELGATLGKEFDLDLAIGLSGLSADDAGAGLGDALRRHILWVDGTAGRARFLHDKLREVVLDRLDPSERRALHLSAARAIQARAAGAGGGGSASTERASAFELAYHFDAAGRSDEALPHALAAAEQARAQHALEIAEANYLMAARGAPQGGVSIQARVAEGLGDVLALRGRYADAEAHLAEALEITDDPVRRAALEGKLGDVAFRRGAQGEACRLLEGALRQLGRRVPKRTIAFLPGILWALIVQVAHTVIPSLVGRSSRPPTESETLAMRLYSRLTYAYWFRSGMIACGWSHLQGMNLAEHFPPSPELAQAYSEHAPVMTMIPWYSRGINYAHRSLAIRTELGDVWGQGQSLHFLGVVLYAASRYRESLARCEEAVSLLARTGDQWEMNTATWHAAFAHYRLGELSRAALISAQLHTEASEIGDQASAGIALSGWSRATDGHVPQALVAAELGRSNEDVHTATEVRLAEALRLLSQDQPTAAVAVLDRARQEIRRARLRQEYAAPISPWLATALRVQIESLPPGLAGQRALRRRRRVATRAACRMARSYRNNLPHALRERALSVAADGHAGRARRLLDRSIEVARSQEASHEEAQSLAARGRLGLTLGWPGALADHRAGERSLAELAVPERPGAAGGGPGDAGVGAGGVGAGGVGASVEGDAGRDRVDGPGYHSGLPSEDHEPPSLARNDRFAALLNAGRAVAAATSLDAVRQALQDAVPVVLRAQHCYTFEVRDSEAV
ncbi:MAG: hypothetical protein QOF81_2459, partial [Acidimicrobiaceae bacterium]|nr:hypothetical protein [Acidimicrobiaceae bacterium]